MKLPPNKSLQPTPVGALVCNPHFSSGVAELRRITHPMKTLALLLLMLVMVAYAGQQPSFRLDASAKRKLVEKAMALKVGDSFQTVTNALGTPTFDQKLARKESSQVVGRSLDYYVVIWERGLVNELHDELVAVTLDEKDRVRSIHIKVTLE